MAKTKKNANNEMAAARAWVKEHLLTSTETATSVTCSCRRHLDILSLTDWITDDVQPLKTLLDRLWLNHLKKDTLFQEFALDVLESSQVTREYHPGQRLIYEALQAWEQEDYSEAGTMTLVLRARAIQEAVAEGQHIPAQALN